MKFRSVRFLSCPLFSLFFLSFILVHSTARACDFCMLGQGVSPYLTEAGKGLTLGMDYRELDHVYNKSDRIDGNGKKEAWLTYSLTGFYPLTDDLTVLVTVPYASKTNVDYDDASGLNTGTLSSGIGDLTITGRYTLFKDHRLESTFIGGLLLGVKLPTGSTNTRDRLGNPIDRHALPGTGSTDFDFGYSGSYSAASGIQITADAVYRVSTQGKWDERDHRYGNMFNYTVKSYYRVAKTEAGGAFMPFIGVSGETTGKEKGAEVAGVYDPEVLNPSTGGTELFADIGLYSILSPTVLVNLGFSKAFFHCMNYDANYDVDPAENYKLNFSLTYLF
jgi:hypothetical protein